MLEESSSLHVDTHGREDDGKVVLVIVENGFSGKTDEGALPADLRGDFVMGQSVGREDWNLLASGDRVHDVDGRNTGLNHFLGVDTRVRIDGLTLKNGINQIIFENFLELSLTLGKLIRFPFLRTFKQKPVKSSESVINYKKYL